MMLGRPTKYDPSWMLDKVIELMRDGASKVEVAAELGITRETFYQWVKEHQEFSEAVKQGEDLSEAWWVRNGRLSLREEKFNATLWYMNMKNRFKWTDRQEQKVESTSEVNVKCGIKLENPEGMIWELIEK